MGKEVFFIKDQIIKVNDKLVKDIMENAALNPSGKMRYCFHENENAGMQEMLFVLPKEGYVRPHMHKNVAETHVIVNGEGYCVLFDDAGEILDSFQVSAKNNFIYRISKQIWHLVIPISEQMIIYEIREGNFNDNTNIFAEWAPEKEDKGKVRKYMVDLVNQIGGTI